MASQIVNDFVCLAEEKFDFDLPPSPASDKGDKEELDDEVFTGAFGHKERCISVGIESTLKEGSSASSVSVVSMELGSWSPLTGEKFDQIIQEAHMVAREIGKNINGGSKPAAQREYTNAVQDKEADPYFAEDTRAKLSALSRPPAPSLSPIKRETFCVQDSPLKQLPPAIQQRLLKAGGVSNPSAAQASTRNASPRRAPQPKAALRGKAALSSSRAVLPSRPTVPGVTQPSAKMRLPPPDRTRLPPPDKRRAVQKRSPSGRPVSRAGSSEDLLSDTASMASDISDSSFNTSLPGKKGLSAPSKAGLRAPPAMKAPPLPVRLIIDKRKNTTSSSSSASSLNSSLTVTPSGKGKFNTSLSSGASGAKPRGPGSLSQLPNSGATSTKPRALSATSRALETMRAGKLTPTTQGKKPTEPQAMMGKSTPVKKPDPAPSNQSPDRRPPRRTCSDPNIPTAVAIVKPSVSVRGSNPKLKAFIAPTPMGQMKRPRRSEVPSPDPMRIVKPKRLGSAISTESLRAEAAVPASAVLQTPTAVVKAIPALPRRSSALPTPVNRRISGIPCITPKSIKRGQTGERLDLLGSGSKLSHGSPIQKNVFQRPRASAPKFVPMEDPSCLAIPQPCVPVFSLEDDSEETRITDPVPSTPQKTSQHTGHSLQHQNTPESSMENRGTPESSTENLDAPESSTKNQDAAESSTENAPESSTENQNAAESSTENQNAAESSTENQDAAESSTENAPESSTENRNAAESSTENQNSPESSTDNLDAPKSSTENLDAPESSTGQLVHPSPEEPQKLQNYTMKTPENKEVLLVDAPAPVLRVQERLLIDLSNTCDLIRAVPLKPTGALLIDLSSPLITWSPIDKKENAMDAPPLINLSF